ncbi:hypothetical protein GCM10009119_37540 [Algoriphagus jejuensis]|uniref:PH (Pleckstrin Homology) domain-containing protein n=1 Tax=Algoriphagus jejuensis TaxID=419934 RepID=A0ABN1N4T2_9BACT
MYGRIFKEEQTYRGTWVMYLILMLEIPTLILVSVVVLSGKSTDIQDGMIALISVFTIMALVMGLIFNIKLETRIDDSGIHYNYFPFVKWRLIEKSRIHQAKIESFNPLMDHGGWGIKGNSTTKAYTVIGDSGLSIDLGEKKKVLIGTQKPKELREFIENWMED